jgi:hypothetical protein
MGRRDVPLFERVPAVFREPVLHPHVYTFEYREFRARPERGIAAGVQVVLACSRCGAQHSAVTSGPNDFWKGSVHNVRTVRAEALRRVEREAYSGFCRTHSNDCAESELRMVVDAVHAL